MQRPSAAPFLTEPSIPEIRARRRRPALPRLRSDPGSRVAQGRTARARLGGRRFGRRNSRDRLPDSTGRFGTPIEPRNFLRFWDRRCEQADLRRITVHDARRTCGSLLADLDVHPRVAMQILRHANFKITMEIYTQVTDQQTHDALKRLGESLG